MDMNIALHSPAPLPVIEGEIERSVERLLADYSVDSCVKVVAKEAKDRLQIGYGIRRGNDFIVIRKPYGGSDEAGYSTSDRRWTLEVDNKIIGDGFLEIGDALDAAGIFKRS